MTGFSRRHLLRQAIAAAPAVALASGAGTALALNVPGGNITDLASPDAELLAFEPQQIAAVPAARAKEAAHAAAWRDFAAQRDRDAPLTWTPELDAAGEAAEAAWGRLDAIQTLIIETGPQTLAGVVVHARVVRQECAHWGREDERAQDWDTKVARWFVDRVLALSGEPEYALPRRMKLVDGCSMRLPAGAPEVVS